MSVEVINDLNQQKTLQFFSILNYLQNVILFVNKLNSNVCFHNLQEKNI